MGATINVGNSNNHLSPWSNFYFIYSQDYIGNVYHISPLPISVRHEEVGCYSVFSNVRHWDGPAYLETFINSI